MCVFVLCIHDLEDEVGIKEEKNFILLFFCLQSVSQKFRRFSL